MLTSKQNGRGGNIAPVDPKTSDMILRAFAATFSNARSDHDAYRDCERCGARFSYKSNKFGTPRYCKDCLR